MEGNFKEARATMQKCLLMDTELYYGYQANIAMLLHDEQDRNNSTPVDYKDENNRNEIAKKIINLIFL